MIVVFFSRLQKKKKVTFQPQSKFFSVQTRSHAAALFYTVKYELIQSLGQLVTKSGYLMFIFSSLGRKNLPTGIWEVEMTATAGVTVLVQPSHHRVN